MEIHDDDPDHFEFILKHIYTQKFDAAAINTLAAGDCVRRVTTPVGIYLVADKYNMSSSLLRKIVSDTSRVLHRNKYTLDVLLSLVPLCYGMISKVDHPFGKLLVKEILRKSRNVTTSDDFKNMVKAHPIFGADMALLLGEESVSYYCERCEESNKELLPDAIQSMRIECLKCCRHTDEITLSTASFW
jgi:hypothetical protein